MPAVDISVVTYRPDFGALTELLGSIREQAAGLELNLLLHDNSCDPAIADRLARMPLFHDAFARVDVQQSATTQTRGEAARRTFSCSIRTAFSSPMSSLR